jgi:hypothetical protein
MLVKRLIACAVLPMISWLMAGCRDGALDGPAGNCRIICEHITIGCGVHGEKETKFAVDECATECIENLVGAPDKCAEISDEVLGCVTRYDDCGDAWDYCLQEIRVYSVGCGVLF